MKHQLQRLKFSLCFFLILIYEEKNFIKNNLKEIKYDNRRM